MIDLRVSVIIPIFNSSETVLRCLSSVLRQTYENIDIICIDDGSTDNSIDLIRQNVSDPRVRIISQENRGLGGARNAGVTASHADYVTFVDSDDTIDPTMIEKLATRAAETGEDIVDCYHAVVDETGAIIDRRKVPVDSKNRDFGIRILECSAHVQACCRLYSRHLLGWCDRVFPEHTLHEDLYYTYKIYCDAGSYSTVEEPLYFWLRRTGSISQSMSRKHIDDIFASNDQCLTYMREIGIAVSHRSQFERRCFHLVNLIYNKLEKYTGEDDLKRYTASRILADETFSREAFDRLASYDKWLHKKLADRMPHRRVYRD